MLWNKVYASKEQAIFIGPSRKPRNRTLLEVAAASNLYISVEKIRTTHQLLRCTLVANTSVEPTWRLQVERPFHFTPSVHLFVQQYEKVKSGGTLAVYAVETCNLRICRAADGMGQIVADVHKGSCSKMFDLCSRTHAQQIKDSAAGGEIADKDGPGEEDQDQDGNMAADDDNDDEEYGLALLRKLVAGDLGKDTVSDELAAAASLAEACSEVDGDLEGVAVRELVEQAASHIDNELDMMSRAEEEIFQKAVAEKNLSMEELQPQINSLLGAGMSEEEAVFEAALNSSKLLGNAATLGTGTGEAEPNAGPSGSSPSSSTAAADPHVALGVSDTDELDRARFSMTAKQMSHRCLVTYSAAFSESIGAVLQCLHACATSVPECSGISLAHSMLDVAGPPSFPGSAKVILISWEVPRKTGRVARVDSEGRLVSMVCVGVNRTARDMSDCRIIHPNIGLSMERVRKKERPQVASHVLRVSKMFVQSESMQLAEAEEVIRELDLLGDGAEGTERWRDVAQGGEECIACGSVELSKNNSLGVTGPANGAQSSRRASFAEQCPLCLLPWHVDCCNAFVEKFKPSLQQIQLHPTPATQAESWG